MRNTLIAVLIGMAVLGAIPAEKIKGWFKDATNIVTPEPKPEGTIPAALETMKNVQRPKWELIATSARTKQFRDRNEAADRISAMLSDSTAEAIKGIQDEVKAATEKDDWQAELANLCDRYARESQ